MSGCDTLSGCAVSLSHATLSSIWVVASKSVVETMGSHSEVLDLLQQHGKQTDFIDFFSLALTGLVRAQKRIAFASP